LPQNWSEAVDVYRKYWNLSKRVLLEKTPANLFKAHNIFRGLKQYGRQAKFLLLTRSPCDWNLLNRNSERIVPMLVRVKSRIPAEHLLHIRYEDLMRDPYGQSQRIVDFLPELRSLDPGMQALHFEGKEKFEAHRRADPMADYALMRARAEAPTASSYRRWRLQTSVESPTQAHLREIELYDGRGKLVPAAAFRSLTSSCGQVANAFDGDQSSEWTTPEEAKSGQWIEIELAEAVHIASIRFLSGRSSVSFMDVLASTDGSSWTRVWEAKRLQYNWATSFASMASPSSKSAKPKQVRRDWLEYARLFGYV